ncbi:MAG: tyrosine-type recombinase/integrase [Pseudomonadota bacterium]
MLTDTKVQRLKPKEKPYREPDQEGLYLLIEPNGIKKWQFRFTWEVSGKKKRPWQSIGRYPEVSLKQARSIALESRELLAQNINPIEYKRQQKIDQQLEKQSEIEPNKGMTFEELFKIWHKHNSESWTYAHARDIRERMDKHLIPHLGDLPLEDIKPRDVIRVLKLVEVGGRVETTRRIKQYTNRIFKFGIGFGHCERNPASELPDDIFLKGIKKNYAHTTDPKVLTQILKAIESYAGDISTKKALELGPYVFLRSKEIAGIRWEEINLENCVIEIPGERMKKKRTHIVPISSKVLEIIEYMRPLSGDCEYLFPSPCSQSRPLGEQTLNPALHRLGFKDVQTFHGFRHTASTMLNEMGFMGDLIEKQLAHEEANKVRGAYNKAQYLAQRKEMMQSWTDYLNGLKLGADIIPFNKKSV